MLAETPHIADREDVRAFARRMFAQARPHDRRVPWSPSDSPKWTAEDFASQTREQMLYSFWGAEVPGSGAWDSMFVGAFVSKADLGFDVALAEPILRQGLAARDGEDIERSTDLGEEFLRVLDSSPRIDQHTAHAYQWRPMFRSHTTLPGRLSSDWAERVRAGWIGQLAGAAFGGPFEGCSSAAIESLYGSVNRYVGQPETLNDDCVYELLALDVLEAIGKDATAAQFGAAWRDRLPFAWSAEWIALENLRSGVEAPRSGWRGNPMHDWIGAQMRAMVFGFVAPGWPLEAARLAQVEATVSHVGSGVDAAVFSSLLTSLAFVHSDPRDVVRAAVTFFAGADSEFAAVVRSCLDVCQKTTDGDVARIELLARFADRYWIHSFPNIAVVIVALWFGDGDFTRSMAIVAKSGLDADCNGGLVGSVIGVMNAEVPSWWANPLEGRIDTYVPSIGSVSIDTVVHQTLQVAEALRFNAR
jgi:ADP-ribosylglycohydrolase